MAMSVTTTSVAWAARWRTPSGALVTATTSAPQAVSAAAKSSAVSSSSSTTSTRIPLNTRGRHDRSEDEDCWARATSSSSSSGRSPAQGAYRAESSRQPWTSLADHRAVSGLNECWHDSNTGTFLDARTRGRIEERSLSDLQQGNPNSGHLDRMRDRNVVPIALRIPRDARGLRVALIVDGACDDDVLARARIPLEIPADPGTRQIRLAQERGPPGRAAVQAVLDSADAADGRPCKSAHALAPGEKRRTPRQRDRGLECLKAQRRLAGVRWPFQHVGPRGGGHVDLPVAHFDPADPLDVVDADPSRNDGPDRKPVIGRQRFAIHRVGEQRVLLECLGEGHGSVHLHRVEPLDEHVQEIPRGVLADPRRLEDRAELDAGPLRDPDRPEAPLGARGDLAHDVVEKPTPVARALERRDDGPRGHGEQVVEGEVERPLECRALDA